MLVHQEVQQLRIGSLKGKTALVTGASSGIGTEFARQLAGAGANVIVVARRADRLEALQQELEAAHGVRVTPLSLDLSTPGGGRTLFDRTDGAGTPIDVLVNNAGFGTASPFVDIPWEKTVEQIQLNIITLTEATWLFARRMVSRGTGHILNVASVGGFLATPNYATYGPGKAYVRNFSMALAHELRATGVRVCCLCPGATESEFVNVAGQKVSGIQKLAFMSAKRCARIGLSALFRGRRLIVSGFMNTLAMWLLRLMPYRLATAIAEKALA